MGEQSQFTNARCPISSDIVSFTPRTQISPPTPPPNPSNDPVTSHLCPHPNHITSHTHHWLLKWKNQTLLTPNPNASGYGRTAPIAFSCSLIVRKVAQFQAADFVLRQIFQNTLKPPHLMGTYNAQENKDAKKKERE